MQNVQMNTETTRTDPQETQEWMKVLILFGMAVYLGYIIFSGNITNYVNERFAWLSYVAVLIFAALGAANAYGIYLKRQNQNAAYRSPESHTTITWSVIMVVALPLLFGTLIPSKPLGAEAVNGNISLSVRSVGAVGAVTKDPLARNVLDWLRVFSNSTNPTEFDGQPADVIGFVYREPNFPEDHFMVARFTVSCCVADAGAIGLPVYAPDAASIADGEWVRVAGDFATGQFRDSRMPILQAQVLEVVEQPEHPYLYP